MNPSEGGISEQERERRALAAALAQRPMPFKPRRFAAERNARRVYWAAVGVTIALMGLGLIWPAPPPAQGYGYGAFLLLAAMLWVRVGFVRQREAARVVVPARGMICPECHFRLAKDVPEGVCPECGTRYEQEALIRLWRAAYGLELELPTRSQIFMERLNAPERRRPGRASTGGE